MRLKAWAVGLPDIATTERNQAAHLADPSARNCMCPMHEDYRRDHAGDETETNR